MNSPLLLVIGCILEIFNYYLRVYTHLIWVIPTSYIYTIVFSVLLNSEILSCVTNSIYLSSTQMNTSYSIYIAPMLSAHFLSYFKVQIEDHVD